VENSTTSMNISWSPIPLYVTTTQYGRIMVNGRLPASRTERCEWTGVTSLLLMLRRPSS
jgi:hypothetical protein